MNIFAAPAVQALLMQFALSANAMICNYLSSRWFPLDSVSDNLPNEEKQDGHEVVFVGSVVVLVPWQRGGDQVRENPGLRYKNTTD